jgi:hypothetical protein
MTAASRGHEERVLRSRHLQERWQQRDKEHFGKFHGASAYHGHFSGEVSTAVVQVPSYVVPPRTYHGLLRYFAQTNNLPAALVLYERMGYAQVSLSFPAALALVSLAAKHMNYEALAHFVQHEALPLSRHSAPRRAQLWHELTDGFARFNTYSNVDSYMRYMLRLLTGLVPAADSPAAASARDAAPQSNALLGDLDALDPFPSSASGAAGLASAHALRKGALDHLWRMWATRGGSAEILSVWDTLRAQAGERGALLDDASVEHFLRGVLRRASPGRADALGSLSGEAAVLAVADLLRHLAHAGCKLAPSHIQRIAVDLPLFVAHAQRDSTNSHSVQAQSAGLRHRGDAALSDVHIDSFVSEQSWQQFCTAHGLSPAARTQFIAQKSPDAVPASPAEGRTQLLAAIDSSLQDLLHAPSAPRSAARVAALARLLHGFNASIGPAGVDHAIDALEMLIDDTHKMEQQRA